MPMSIDYGGYSITTPRLYEHFTRYVIIVQSQGSLSLYIKKIK